MPSVYLDNNATTPVLPEVVDAMVPYFGRVFGNASSVHTWGQQARDAVETAREQVAALVGAEPREIIFTSGGTEADNAAILGVGRALRERGRHVLTSRIEHPAVLRACETLEREGFRVTYLPARLDGRVAVDDVVAGLTDDTVLISIMYANNETGVIQPLPEIVEIARRRRILVHTDAVQALGKIPVHVRSLDIDLLSISAHKLHGPKGVGALFLRHGTPFEPFLVGGGHERNRRGGTENVPGMVGFGKACEIMGAGLEAFESQVGGLRDRLERALLTELPAAQVNGAATGRLPNTTNISFCGLQGESLLVAFDFAGIAVSTGAACASGSIRPSHVLVGMGLDEQRIQGAIRFSLSRLTTTEEIDYAIATVPAAIRRMLQTAGRKPVDV